jgi:hypothetical protein
VGKDDRFLPFMKPPTPWAWKWWRWGMGIPIALVTHNWWYIITYFIATNVFVYGENSWLAKLFGEGRWFVSGCALGLASLDPMNGLWCGFVMVTLKFFDIDQAYLEFLMGSLSTLVFLF